MQKSLLFIAATLASLACQAETVKGNGKLAEQNRQLGDFQAIRSEGAWNLDVSIGAAPSIRIKADENLLPIIETLVEANQLVIRFKDRQDVHVKNTNSLKIEVTVPELRAYSHAGVGKTAFHGLKGEKFSVNYMGAGLVSGTGKVDKFDVVAKGTGALDFSALKSREAVVGLSGVGSVSVYASDSLSAKVDGIGSLTYYGNPGKISKTVSGIGVVRSGD